MRDQDAKWKLSFEPALSAAAERVEQQVFQDRFGYDQALWEAEYRPYDDQTVWVTLSHEEQVVGAIRVIVGTPASLKFTDDLQRFWKMSWSQAAEAIGLDEQVTPIECATLSVLKAYRGHDRQWPAKALCAAFGQFVMGSGATHSVQIMDPAVRQLLVYSLGLPFDPIPGCEEVDYHGLLIPVSTHVSEHPNAINGRDKDFERFYIYRDETVRGGTQQPVIDLRAKRLTELHQTLIA